MFEVAKIQKGIQMKTWIVSSAIAFLSLAPISWADAVPACLSKGVNLQINNAQVIQWKSSTQNQFLARAHVKGSLTRIYPDHSGHHHFEIQLDNNAQDTLEVVYNEGFGATPAVRVGDMVEACGDYITSDAPTSQYPASPDGAIIHWIHNSPNPASHPSGFLMINGVLYGQGPGN